MKSVEIKKIINSTNSYLSVLPHPVEVSLIYNIPDSYTTHTQLRLAYGGRTIDTSRYKRDTDS